MMKTKKINPTPIIIAVILLIIEVKNRFIITDRPWMFLIAAASAVINNQLPARRTLRGIESSSITMRGLYHSHSSSAKAAVMFLT